MERLWFVCPMSCCARWRQKFPIRKPLKGLFFFCASSTAVLLSAAFFLGRSVRPLWLLGSPPLLSFVPLLLSLSLYSELNLHLRDVLTSACSDWRDSHVGLVVGRLNNLRGFSFSQSTPFLTLGLFFLSFSWHDRSVFCTLWIVPKKTFSFFFL